MQNPPKLKHLIAGLGLAASIMAYFAMPQENTGPVTVTPQQEKIYHAYQDGGGVWTIGRGHTLHVHKGMTATETQIQQWYVQDVHVAEAAYDRLVSTQHHPNVKAAAMDFIFNAGQGNFAHSHLRIYLNNGDRFSSCNEFPKWNRAAGKDCRKKSSNCAGILKRRNDEKELCLSNELSVCDFAGGTCHPWRGL